MKKAFTLIEMIIVLVILLILVSLFIKSTGTAVEKSKRLSCAMNIREIINAMLIYVNDNYPAYTIPGEKCFLPKSARKDEAGNIIEEGDKLFINYVYGCLYYSNLNSGITNLNTYVCPSNPHTPPIPQGYGKPFLTNYTEKHGNKDYTDYLIIRRKDVPDPYNPSNKVDTTPDLKNDAKTNAIIWEADNTKAGINHKVGRNIGFLNGSVKFIPSNKDEDYPYNIDYAGNTEPTSIRNRITTNWEWAILGMDDRSI